MKKKADVLAEELGHFLTVGDISDLSVDSNRKQEHITRGWSYDKQIGLLGLIDTFKHHHSIRFEIAKYLNVSEDTLDEAIEYYRNKYDIVTKVDNYLIHFESYLHVDEFITLH